MRLHNDTMVVEPPRLLYYLLKADLILSAQKQGYRDFLEKIETVVAKLGGDSQQVWGDARLIAEFSLYYVRTHYQLELVGNSIGYRPRSKGTMRSAFGRLRSSRRDEEWDKAWIELPYSAWRQLLSASAEAGTSYLRMQMWPHRVSVSETKINALRADEAREGWPFHARDAFIIPIPSYDDIVPLIDTASRLPRDPPRARPERDEAIRKIIKAYLAHTQPSYGPAGKRLKSARRSQKGLTRFIESIQACYLELIPQGFGGLDSKSVRERQFTNATSL